MNWIAVFGSMAIVLVVYGGFVRLTRSGLSIVEWNPVNGTLPPLSEDAWEGEFAKYQQTPEYQQINRGMSLAKYREIFLVEWLHRLFARIAGFVFAIPFFVFLLTKRIPWRESPVYVVMGVLFLSQAAMGWIMVSSGLVDRPSVSHFALAGHLFLALALIGLSAWTWLGHRYGVPDAAGRSGWSPASSATLAALIGLLLQIAYGAFTAGLKAGHVSNSWPQMLGRWIPRGLLSQVQPALRNLVDAPLTVAFIHRWLAFAALLVAYAAYRRILRTPIGIGLRAPLRLIGVFGLAQIGLGIAVVLSGVDMVLALVHQFNAICLFIAAVFLLHRLRSQDRSVGTSSAQV
jgi:cytochrome c oxidase assembly protein subunit 15